ncbi:MAG: hypothetical protein ACYTGB_16370, partial [Planctomycetota bacterium]
WQYPPAPKSPGKPVAAGSPEKAEVEVAGPVRATVMLRGKYPGLHNGMLGYTVRITAWSGQSFIKVRAWLENHGAHGYTTRDNKPPFKPEWYAFDGMAVELGLAGMSSAECEGAKGGKLKVYQRCKPAKSRHDPAFGYGNMEYTISGGATKKGERTDGVVTLTGGGKLVAAIRHFWQNYEKAVEFDGSTLKLWLWPLEGQWPREFIGHACPGYSHGHIQPLRLPGTYNLPGSVHKGHEIVLDFSGRDGKESSAELSQPLFALAPPEYYASTEAAPALFAPPGTKTGDDDCDGKLASWTKMTLSAADPKGKSSIWHGRRTTMKPGYKVDFGYWYGWMDFGDLALPGPGTASLHYDWPYLMCLSFMRTGKPEFLRLADEMVRHRVEVDQQWSDSPTVLKGYHGFQRNGRTYAHFHCERFTRAQPHVANTWLAGPVFYYMLTGDPKAREAFERTAKFIAPAWETMRKSENYYVRRQMGDMQMAARTIMACCSLYALDAEKKWLDLALGIVRKEIAAKHKRLGPHLHARNQIGGQSYAKEDIKYCYSIAAFCLLHHYTQDKDLFKLLQEGCDKDFPENFFDAPLFLADLH